MKINRWGALVALPQANANRILASHAMLQESLSGDTFSALI